MSFTSGLARHREALAAGLPEWDGDSQSASSSSSSLSQSGLCFFNKFGSQSFRRGRCGSPHPRQMYSTKQSPNPGALLALKNLPSPPQATSPTGDGPLYSPQQPQAKGLKIGNTNNSNSHGAKFDKNRIKMGIGKPSFPSEQQQQVPNGHVDSTKVKGGGSGLTGSRLSGGQRQQVTRVQVHQAAVTKLERTQPLPGETTELCVVVSL